MRFEIGWTNPKDSSQDTIILEGETFEEIREKAKAEISKRHGINPWSRQL